MARLMSQAAYARHRGCSRQAVSKAVKTGRIKLIDGKIDPDLADRQWALNTKDTDGVTEDAPKRRGKSKTTPPNTQTTGGGTGYNAANTAWKTAQAQRELMRAQREAGELVQADSLERVLVGAFARHKKAAEALPRRLASDLDGQSRSVIEEVLETEIQALLANLAADLAEPEELELDL